MGENFTDLASSTPEFIFEYTDPSLQGGLQGEVYSNMNLCVLKLKLHEVHFADQFPGAELARRRRTCLQIAPDVNKNDFQDKFAGYGIYRFQNLPTNQKEN